MPNYTAMYRSRREKALAITKLDALGLNILMSDEATEDIKKYLESPISMVDANGNLVYGLNDGRIVKFTLFATSWHPLPETSA